MDLIISTLGLQILMAETKSECSSSFTGSRDKQEVQSCSLRGFLQQTSQPLDPYVSRWEHVRESVWKVNRQAEFICIFSTGNSSMLCSKLICSWAAQRKCRLWSSPPGVWNWDFPQAKLGEARGARTTHLSHIWHKNRSKQGKTGRCMLGKKIKSLSVCTNACQTLVWTSQSLKARHALISLRSNLLSSVGKSSLSQNEEDCWPF